MERYFRREWYFINLDTLWYWTGLEIECYTKLLKPFSTSTDQTEVFSIFSKRGLLRPRSNGETNYGNGMATERSNEVWRIRIKSIDVYVDNRLAVRKWRSGNETKRDRSVVYNTMINTVDEAKLSANWSYNIDIHKIWSLENVNLLSHVMYDYFFIYERETDIAVRAAISDSQPYRK